MKRKKILKIAMLCLFMSLLIVACGERTIYAEDEIWIEDGSGCTGEKVQIAVSISNPDTETDAFGFDLHYCTDMLEYVSCIKGELTNYWYFIECNEQEAGRVRVGGFSTTPIPAGSDGSIIILNFQVTYSGCELYDECEMYLSNFEDDISGWTAQTGTFTYYCFPTATPTATRTCTPTHTPTPTPLTDILQVSFAEGCSGESIQVPVFISNPNNAMDAFGFDLNYCTDMLEFTSCQKGELTQDWTYFDCNESQPGVLIIGGFGSPVVPAGSAGSIVLLNFDVECETCNNGDECILSMTDLVDDIADWIPLPGAFTYYCSPTPTHTSTPQPTDTPIPTDDFMWVSNASGGAGQLIQIAVTAENPDTPFDAFGFDLIYDENMLTFASGETGTLTHDWPYIECNGNQPGRIIAGGFDTEDIPAGSSGSLLLFYFTVTCGACDPGDQSAFVISDKVDDIKFWDAGNGTFTFIELTPTMTCTPEDTPTASPTLSPFATLSPTASPTLSPTDVPTETPTATPVSPTPTETVIPTPPPIPSTGTAGFLFMILLIGAVICFGNESKRIS